MPIEDRNFLSDEWRDTLRLRWAAAGANPQKRRAPRPHPETPGRSGSRSAPSPGPVRGIDQVAENENSHLLAKPDLPGGHPKFLAEL